MGVILLSDLEIGLEYTKEDIENILIKPKINKSIGRIRGIVPIYLDEEQKEKIIILFSGVSELYDDKREGATLYYIGEQKPGHDQRIKYNNKSLADANVDNSTIYVFENVKETKKWTYLGIFELQDIIEDKDDDNLRIYIFQLEKTPFEDQEDIKKEIDIFKESTTSEPKIEEGEPERISSSVLRRESIFRKEIKNAYNKTCAICGKRRLNMVGNPEVEAAHILSKKLKGPDHPQNGVSLCRLHHWAFDNGLLSIDNNYRVIIKDEIKKDKNHEEIYKYEGNQIRLPENKRYWPHLGCLKKHRDIHGFDKV
jgi:putative restriction endonuclease